MPNVIIAAYRQGRVIKLTQVEEEMEAGIQARRTGQVGHLVFRAASDTQVGQVSQVPGPHYEGMVCLLTVAVLQCWLWRLGNAPPPLP